MTIRKRLTLGYAALLTAIIILFGTITFAVMRFTMVNNIDESLSETARLVLVNSRMGPAPMFGADNEINIELAELDVFRASGVYVQAWLHRDDGYQLAGQSRKLGTFNDPLDPDAIGFSETGNHFNTVNINDTQLRVLTKAIYFQGSSGLTVVGDIQVAADMEAVNEATDLYLLVLLFSSGLAIVGAAALSLWFSHRALKPIEEITRAASQIAGTEDLKTRLSWDGPNDELGQLISVFNRMMGRLEHLFSVQRRFIGDVSHELRTPLTAIRGNVDIIRRYGMDPMALEAIQMEGERMSRLVNDLLMLARADYGGLSVDLYPMDLENVIMEIYEQSKVLAKDRDLTIKLGEFDSVRVNGNADRIRQTLYNLVTNALKFTEDGGTITMSLKRVNDTAVINISDTGIGIAPEDLEHIFERFYQSDTSRAHTHEDGGFGLGLSIAKWIVDAHQGKITAKSQLGKGTTFTISLPIYKEADESQDEHSNATRPRIPLINWQRPAITRNDDSQEQHHVSEQQEHHQ